MRGARWTAWRSAGLVALLIVSGHAGHPRTAGAADQPLAHSAAGVTARMIVPQMSPAWFLNRTRRLLNDGRAAEVHQLAHAALDLYPHSAELRLGAAFAAMRAGHCRPAIRHLEPLRKMRLAVAAQRRADIVRAACRGPWRWQALMGVSAGYRPSLVDRRRDVEIRLQPGSRLHAICLRLAALCDPHRALVSRGKRDSGIDLWMDLTVRRLYRAGASWDFDLDGILFQRRPRRPGYAGDGAILRATAMSRWRSGRQIRIGAETGASRFQQGRADLAIAQTHRRADIGLSLGHAASLQSFIGAAHLKVRSRWLNLARTRYDYRLDKHLAGALTMSLGGASERSRQSGPGLMPGSRTREVSIGLRWDGHRIAARLHHERRHQSFQGRLPFLVAPHRARTRTTRLSLMNGTISGWLNLKVVVSFEYRKISTPDPFRPPTSKTLLLRVSREIFTSP